MFQLIEKLRNKSDNQKKQIAFLFSALFVGVIFIVWLSVIYPDFRKRESQEANAISVSDNSTDTFKTTISKSLSALGEQITNIKQVIHSLTDGTTYYNSASTTEASMDINQ